jgi:RNA polymerase sigma factor (sigma-70 family)
MSRADGRFVNRWVGRSAGVSAGGPADADLLRRWVAHRDDAAFELLLRRHAPMVLGVCRRVLGNPHDADDAFQATFLVLARKAGSVSRGEAVAGWLYRVAWRSALRLRTRRAARAGREVPGVGQLPAAPGAEPAGPDVGRVLDEEINRLPARHRAVVVLCCVEGKTGEEAARLLGCPAGTVSSRLTRARERLRGRLARRGVAPAALTFAALSADPLAAPAAALVDSTLPAALLYAAGWPDVPLPPRPTALANGVIRTMTLAKLKLVGLFITAGLLAAGAVLAGDGPRPADAPKPKANATTPPPTAEAQGRVSRNRCVAEPAGRAELYPTVAGPISQLTVDIGDHVKRGQLLAAIEAPMLELDVRQAGIGLQQSKGLLSEAEARVATAQAAIEAAKGTLQQREAEVKSAQATVAYRKRQLDRYKEATGVAASVVDEKKEQYQTALTAIQNTGAAVMSAQAEVRVTEGKLAQAKAAVQSARLNVESAKLGLDKAKLALERTQIRAPFDGVVTRHNYFVGDTVRPDAATTRPPLLTLVRADAIRAVVQVPDRDVPRLKPGIPVEVVFDALPNLRAKGTVSRIGYVEDPRTATMRVEIDLPNPDGNFRPGMTGTATLRLDTPPAHGE